MKALLGLVTAILCLGSSLAAANSSTITYPSRCDEEAMANVPIMNPSYRVAPKFPIKAARNGIEGYVILEFDVNELGEVVNINPLESYPRSLFLKSGVEALKEWRYKPRLENDEVVTTECLHVQLDFKFN